MQILPVSFIIQVLRMRIENSKMTKNIQILFWQNLRFKRNKHKCDFHYVAVLMMTPQILKSVGFSRTQKSRYIEDETFALQIKNSLVIHQGLLYDKE